MKMLGIDYGTKKIGLAVSDEEGRIAFPRIVLKNDGNAMLVICDFCKKENIEGIVIGESLNFKGEKNKVMDQITPFKTLLEEKTSVPVFFESEFLSSKQARNVHDSGELNDASAAAIILQSYLDKVKNKSGKATGSLLDNFNF